ncbi:hypothetical protein QQF64_001662 [Cirrhinus molitorella]|uniref:Immunoglobulin domain-containing protein n=1 Tax=Cirrhinus molitorella TaxID=172907 RepID=A0ABR3P148_9TELE
MLLQRYLTAVTCAVFISTGAVLGQDQIKAVGDTVSFRPANLNPPFTSIIWKHRSGSDVIKAIEWDIEDGFSIPNPRFKDITTLDEKTGQITITNLALIHSGVYTIYINSREQEQRFMLKVEMPVPKPEIEIERSSNPDVVYLRCRYSEKIIWKNAAGKILTGSTSHPPGEFITVKNIGNPENFYTCTLKNDVSEETSDPVYERDLFKGQFQAKSVGDTVSFRPTNINPPFTSIIWKHRSGSDVIKAIEWDIDDGFSIPNPRFKDITTFDEKTGHITITNLALIHSGVYTIDINSKEQEERFMLKVEKPVPKPEIEIERSSNPDVVYLRCRYSEKIIWKNAAGKILTGSTSHLPGEFITVKNIGNPENFYTCTLKNDVSEETSDPVYERDLFKGQFQAKSVGDTVSFRPTNINPPFTSIIWKHRSGSDVIKAIEWDIDDGFSIPNPRFKDITTFDEKTGHITITNLALIHSGVYTIDINSKEQEERFMLKVESQDQAKAVGDTVSFHPTNINPLITSIIWKHRSGSDVVKAIEWDIEDGFSISNPRFKDITTLDKTTGKITITNLALIHSGVYTIDINSKDQEKRFTLKIEMPVPKPEIEIERISNPDAVYLRCRYSETIIWKNAAGETLNGSTNLAKPPGEFITVENKRNPENFYTCTLKNDVSEETSDPVYERDLFKGSNAGSIAWVIVIVLVLILILIVIGWICAYLLSKPIYNRVNKICPCLEAQLDRMGCCTNRRKEYNLASTGQKSDEDNHALEDK